MHKWSLKFLQFAALAVALGVLATAYGQSTGSWTMKAPVPARLNEVAVAAVGGKIHVMGGSVLGFTGPYHVEYDPAKDAWRARAPVPRALDHMGAVVLNGKIYAVGGFVGGGTHRDGQNSAFEYDPSLNSWRILAPMKAGRGSVGVAEFEGKIHAIGGRAPDGTTVATHEVYDPGTNTWKDLAPLPKARDHAAVVTAEGKIYFAGGRFGASSEPTNMHGHLRSENEYLDLGTADANATQRARRHILQGPVLGVGRRASARHVCRKRGLRSESKELEDARSNAWRKTRDRRRNHRRSCLPRRRIVEAWIRRGNRSIDRF